MQYLLAIIAANFAANIAQLLNLNYYKPKKMKNLQHANKCSIFLQKLSTKNWIICCDFFLNTAIFSAKIK